MSDNEKGFLGRSWDNLKGWGSEKADETKEKIGNKAKEKSKEATFNALGLQDNDNDGKPDINFRRFIPAIGGILTGIFTKGGFIKRALVSTIVIFALNAALKLAMKQDFKNAADPKHPTADLLADNNQKVLPDVKDIKNDHNTFVVQSTDFNPQSTAKPEEPELNNG